MEPGFYTDLSNEGYHSSPGISKSGLDEVSKCPALYKARYLDGVAKKETAAMLDGRALHVSVLEPEKFSATYAVCPKCDKRTTKGKEAWESFCVQNAGKEIVTPDDYDKYMRIAESVRANQRAAAILAQGQAETSMFHIDEPTGELVKVRPDWFVEDVLVDLKFMASAHPQAFSRECYSRRYYVQSAFYPYVAGAVLKREFNSFIFIVVEKEPPFLVSLYEADEDMIRIGTEEYRANLQVYADCKRAAYWPGYNDGNIVPVSLPRWAMPKDIIYDNF